MSRLMLVKESINIRKDSETCEKIQIRKLVNQTITVELDIQSLRDATGARVEIIGSKAKGDLALKINDFIWEMKK